jgi:hypothetical protein
MYIHTRMYMYVRLGAQTPGARLPGRLVFVRYSTQYLLVLSMEFALCHTSGAYNFEVAPTFSKICALLTLG